jgi:hypothetical protein
MLASIWLVIVLSAATGSNLAATSSPSATTAPSTTPSQNLEERKLQLELEKLESDTSSEARIRAWLPSGTILVGMVGAGLGYYQFRKNAGRDRDVRIESQVDANVDRLADFAGSSEKSIAGVQAALHSLNALVPLLTDGAHRRDQITEMLETITTDELDFEDYRQIKFDVIAIRSWPTYRKSLVEDKGLRTFLLYRYQQALRNLSSRHKKYVSSVRYQPDDGYTVEDYIKDEQVFLLFQRLVAGYQEYLELLGSSPERDEAIRGFAEATNNAQLTEDLFGPLLDGSVRNADT